MTDAADARARRGSPVTGAARRGASRWTVRDNMTHGSSEIQLYMADECYLDGNRARVRV